MTALVVAATLRLAIYYGYPTLVNGAAGDLDRAAEAFARYDVVVFGDGLELDPADAPDAASKRERAALSDLVARIRRLRPDVEIYGYVDLGSSQQLRSGEIAWRIDRWQAARATGIFFDEAGADFGVTPARRQAAVAAAHARRLRVFMNAFNPDDLFADDGRVDAGARLGDDDAQIGRAHV